MSSVALPGRSSPQDRGAPGGGGRGDGQGDGQKADDASDGESSDDGELDIIVYVKKPNEQVPLKVATCIDHSVAIFKGLVKKVAASHTAVAQERQLPRSLQSMARALARLPGYRRSLQLKLRG